MSTHKQILRISLVILIALTTNACGATSPKVTPALKNTLSPLAKSSGMVDVGGYKLAYQCFGQGTPTVIIESAVNDAPTATGTWDWVINGINTITRICIYDRAGLGPSGVAPTPRTSQDVAKDLHVLLSKIPLQGPYILVGHSIGGFHVRVFAHLYPQDVAGIILVDSTPTDQMKAFATAYPTYTPNEASILTSNRAAIFDLVPPNEVEGLDMIASAEQVRQAGALGNLPLIVISQSPDPNHFAFPGFSVEDQERLSASWQRQQADIATLSSKGILITAKTAGHYIPLEEPQIVIDAIIQMVQEIRKQSARSQELYIGVIIGIVIVVISFLLLIIKKAAQRAATADPRQYHARAGLGQCSERKLLICVSIFLLK